MNDYRKPLPEGTVLSFPGMECTITKEVGHGSNAFAYYGYYPDQEYPSLKHRVLVKELFPYLPEEDVRRDENGAVRYSMPSASMTIQRKSFERAVYVHMQLQEQYPERADVNPDFSLNTYALNNTLYSVSGFSGGRTLDQEHVNHHLSLCSLKDHAVRMLKLLDVLESFHGSDLLHLDISPDNILLIGSGKKERVSLIDYNSVHTTSELRDEDVLYYSVKPGYTAPEVRHNRIYQIGYPSDLYSAAAVFFWMLLERPISEVEATTKKLPDLSEIPCLQKQPASVRNLVGHILRKGLYPRIAYRYQTTGQMKADFSELLDRIDGIGITHAALWEHAAENTRKIISSNTAYSYLTDEELFYPLAIRDSNGADCGLSDFITSVKYTCGEPVLLNGKGGSGKTTVLLKMAASQNRIYRETDPAILYISLYGIHTEVPQFLLNSILRHLHYRIEDQEFSAYNTSAGQQLLQLLSEPIQTKTGQHPRLVLLLDGLNETSGDNTQLLREITQWSGYQGIRLIMTSRSDLPLSGCSHLQLCPLEDSYLTDYLKKSGVSNNLSRELLDLLHTPLMLSLYLQTLSCRDAATEISDSRQLMEQYLLALLKKELEKDPENSDKYWQNMAAVYYVLPSIAVSIMKEGHALSDQELLPVIESCYKRLKTKGFQRVFPEWIGHSKTILGDAENADAWYGLMVQRILWNDLGLLIIDENRNYRIFHQNAEEYLKEKASVFQKKFIRQKLYRKFRNGLILGLLLFVGIAGASVVLSHLSTPKIYDTDLMENVLGSSVAAYETSCDNYEEFTEFLEAAGSENPLADFGYVDALKKINNYIYQSEYSEDMAETDNMVSSAVQSLLNSGEVSPWSNTSFDSSIYEYLTAYPVQQEKRYDMMTNAILKIQQSDQLSEQYPDYMEDVEEYLSMDQLVLAAYYQLLIQPEIEGMDASQAADYYSLHTAISSDTLAILQEEVSKGADLRALADTYRKTRDEFYSSDLAYMRRIVKNEVETD